MDLSKLIIYNGVSNSVTQAAGGSPTTGVSFDHVDFSNVDIDGYLEKRALQDGLDASDLYLGARRVSIQGAVFGSTVGDGFDRLQAVLAGFSPTLAYTADTANLGFLAMTYYQPTANIATWPVSAYPNGIPLQMYLRPSAPPSYAIDNGSLSSNTGKGIAFKFSVQLVARDPRKYVQTAVSSTITTSTKTASYRGDYPTFPIVTITLTASGTNGHSITLGGFHVDLNLSSASGKTLTVDFSKRTVVDQSGVNHGSYVLSTTTGWGKVQSGTTFTRSESAGISAETVAYSEAFS